MTVSLLASSTFTFTQEQSGGNVIISKGTQKLGTLLKVNEPIRLGGCLNVSYVTTCGQEQGIISLTPIDNINVGM